METDGTLSKYWREEGYVVVKTFDVDYTPPTWDEMVSGIIEALRAQLFSIRAEAEAKCTLITGRINRLLALEYTPSEKLPTRQQVHDVTDVDFGDGTSAVLRSKHEPV
jgi:hypothetical protein